MGGAWCVVCVCVCVCMCQVFPNGIRVTMDRTRGRGFCCRRGFLGLGSGLHLVPFSIPLVDHEDCFAFFFFFFFFFFFSGSSLLSCSPSGRASTWSGVNWAIGVPYGVHGWPEGNGRGAGGMGREKTVCVRLIPSTSRLADSGFGEQAAADRIGGGKSRGLSWSGAAPCLFLLIPNASSRAPAVNSISAFHCSPQDARGRSGDCHGPAV